MLAVGLYIAESRCNMQRFVEELIGRLEERRKSYNSHVTNRDDVCMADGLEIAIGIVKELAESYKIGE